MDDGARNLCADLHLVIRVEAWRKSWCKRSVGIDLTGLKSLKRNLNRNKLVFKEN